MIKAIIFDLGGVILPEKFISACNCFAKELGFDLKEFNKLKRVHQLDLLKGKMKFLDFFSVVKEKSSTKMSLVQIAALWDKIYLEQMPLNDELLNVVDKLRRNYLVGMISNLFDLNAKLNKKRNVFSHFFPCVLSCKIQMAKPDKEIFDLFLQKSGKKAAECIFIDDNEGNLSAAKKFGFKTIKYLNNSQLISDLKEFGVEVE